jgi:hypothetical protein
MRIAECGTSAKKGGRKSRRGQVFTVISLGRPASLSDAGTTAVRIDPLNEEYECVLKSDVEFRFLIDMTSLG